MAEEVGVTIYQLLELDPIDTIKEDEVKRKYARGQPMVKPEEIKKLFQAQKRSRTRAQAKELPKSGKIVPQLGEQVVQSTPPPSHCTTNTCEYRRRSAGNNRRS